ncbi:unnamed protein product, partial [Trichobilharzia regenti]
MNPYFHLAGHQLESYSVTQSTVVLNVSSPINTGGMPTLAYELTYRAFGGPEGWYGPVAFPLDASAKPKFELTGLLGGTNYQLKLFARSIVGQGTPYSFSVQTSPSTRPGPVEVIHSEFGIYPYGHVINWIPPINGGSAILGYRIRVRSVEADLNSISSEEKILPTSQWRTCTPFFSNPYLNYYHLAPLKPGTTYQYGFLNRTPTLKPLLQQIFPGRGINYRNSEQSKSSANLLMHFRQNDLVPIWYLFETPSADELYPPPLIFADASSTYACQFFT